LAPESDIVPAQWLRREGMTLPASKDHATRFCRERILSTFWFLRDCRVTGDALSWDSNKLDRRSCRAAESGDLRNPVLKLCITEFIRGKYDFA